MPDIVLPSDHSAPLLAGFRQGGDVIYPRHTETTASPEPTVRDLADCSWQRDLNAQVRAQSAAIGAQLRELGIADGTVESSPFCRTRQTAELVFGHLAKVNPDLFYHVSQLPAEVLAADTKLIARLGQRPPEGGNLVLVGHAPHHARRVRCRAARRAGRDREIDRRDGTFRIVGRLSVNGISVTGGL